MFFFLYFICSGNRSSKTFKPKKNIPEGSHQYELLKHAEATLGSGNLRQAVMLPEGEDLNEWIAVNSEWMKATSLVYREHRLVHKLLVLYVDGLCRAVDPHRAVQEKNVLMNIVSRSRLFTKQQQNSFETEKSVDDHF